MTHNLTPDQDPVFSNEVAHAHPISPAVDYYLGRALVGSEAAVELVLDRFPELSVIEDKGRFVLPLLRRHALPGLPDSVAQGVFDTVVPKLEAATKAVVLPSMGLRLRTNKKGYPSVIIGLPTDNPLLKRLIARESYAIDMTLKAAGIKAKRGFMPDAVRLTDDLDDTAVAQEVLEIVNRSMPVQPIQLSRLGVCSVPSK